MKPGLEKVQKTIKAEQGIYCLILECVKPASIHCEKYKNVIFPAGFYYYIGSAQKNLSSRINRHLKREKKIHWHIDYLTMHPDFSIKNVLLFKSKTKSYECKLSQDFAGKFKLQIIAPGFGSSDCNKCISHLYYGTSPIPYSHFISRYHSIERLIPSSKETF